MFSDIHGDVSILGGIKMGNNQFEVKIGNTKFIVTVKEAETAKDTIDEAFRKLCRKAVIEEFLDADPDDDNDEW